MFSTHKAGFWASISTRLREYDNILCPSFCWNDLSSQAPHKSSPLRENFKITFKSVLGHVRFVLMLVLQLAKSCDVTSLLKRVYLAAEKGNLQAGNKLIKNASCPAELRPRNKVTFCLFVRTLNCTLALSVAITVA